MTYLFLSIVSFTAMMLIFKLIERFKADTFQTIVFNYITASVLGFSIMGTGLSVAHITHTEWFSNAIVVGAAFITLFNIVAITAQKVGISVSIVANKMSVIIPVIFAFFLYGDSVTFLKISGIIMALAGVFMATKKDEELKIPAQYFLLPIILFVGSGLLDTFLNYTEKYYLADTSAFLTFIPTVFSIAAIGGGSVMIFKILVSPSTFSPRSIFWGIILGFFNYTSLYFMLESLKLENLESSVVFTINNIGIVSLSAISARIFFKEHLSNINKIGIVVCLAAILIIALA
jgi:drug/metabolite transporter (DMT)-like permease